MTVWDIEVGEKVTRQEIMDAYGATIQGGIQASRKTPNIMLYTDLSLAEKHGYTFDGWSPTEDGVFYYSGQGPQALPLVTKRSSTTKTMVAHYECSNWQSVKAREGVDATSL